MENGKAALVALLCMGLTVSGCSVADIRGQAPTTIDECEANWLQETGAVALDAVEVGTRADNAVSNFFISISRIFNDPSTSHARYRACLDSVGVTDVNAVLATDSDQARDLGATVNSVIAYGAPKRPAYCPRGASVLYGGAGYCVGR